ncbi:MAG: hypothetical protein JSS49_17840 [Planctomycetes bacterium]|nr:hypothetical protein [Planctomycetota bacterium]
MNRGRAVSVVPYLVLLFVAILAGNDSTTFADGDKNDEADGANAKRSARLVSMRELARQFEMKASGSTGDATFELRPEPIFRYSDQPRGFEDATLWSWNPAGSTGRPAVIAKVEAAITPARVPYWHFCVTSLADQLVSADFEGSRRMKSTKPGVSFHTIPRAPATADKPLPRQRQMKELVARFAATIVNTHPDTKKPDPQEMRLLVTPIHRYAEESKGLQDGTIFGLTTNGTNPDMLIVIESQGATLAKAEWKYAIVKMTIAEVHVRLDGTEVWQSPRNGPRETWDSFTKMPRTDD